MMEGLARHWIAGEWTGSADRSEAITLDPADGSEVCRYADGSRPEADAAIAAARQVYDGSGWAHDPRRRARALLEMADALDARRPQLAETLCRENGKPLGECLHEVTISSSELRFYAGLARANFGRIMETEPGQMSAHSAPRSLPAAPRSSSMPPRPPAPAPSPARPSPPLPRCHRAA
jgi:acyl-CoA reductase-like NAD-dependent aldehyde dehydrogenase